MTAGQSALVFLDLDYFKRINDSAGHAAGDALLRQLAELMSDHMRASDIVARLGGDEFGLIMRNCSVVNAGPFMQKLIAEICRYEFSRMDKYSMLVPVPGWSLSTGNIWHLMSLWFAPIKLAMLRKKRAGGR